MTESPPLRIAVLAPDAPDAPGLSRLLEILAGDPRWRVAGLFRTGPARQALSPALSALLRAEARAVPRGPVFTPGWDAVRADVPQGAFTPEAVAAVTPDLVVDLAWAAGAPAAAALAPHGLWRLDAHAPAGGLEAVFGQWPATPVRLLRQRSAEAAPEVIGTADYDRKFLAARNRAFVREKSVQMIGQALARLACGALPGGTPAPALPGPPRPADWARYAAATAAEAAARAARKVRVRAGRPAGGFAVRLGRADGPDFDPGAAREIPLPAGTYWGDPFLLEREGALFLFYEEYRFDLRRGHIAAARVEGETVTPLGPVLTAPHHLSYPFVFAHGDEVLMLPESHQAGRLEIWRATDFPTGWTRAATALDGVRAVDSVLFAHHGRWWLLTNICRDSFGDFGSELHLYEAEGPLLGRLRPHPLNPVAIGSRTARGGGRVFARDGRLFRWSQDNSHGLYGYGLNLMEITELTPERYSERLVRRIAPDFAPGLIGCHHADIAAGRFVMDVRKR